MWCSGVTLPLILSPDFYELKGLGLPWDCELVEPANIAFTRRFESDS